jgi:protein-tyrosine phosphatase
MLRRLGSLGFKHVVATPHMRPGMFDNRVSHLKEAYERARTMLHEETELPSTSLGSEHFFDSEVIDAVKIGRGLPYRHPASDTSPDAVRSGGAILVEFRDLAPLQVIERQLFELQTLGYIPVIAHPERYRAVWESPEALIRLVELGSVALLDIAALVGKYGRRSKAAARRLLEEQAYDAACTDSHRPDDVDLAAKGMAVLEKDYGPEELQYLLADGPAALLAGQRPTAPS